MMHEYIRDSLTKEGRSEVYIWEKKYTVQDMKSGLLTLKALLRDIHIDNNATSTEIRKKLSNLDTYIATVRNDITKFNTHVKI